MGSPTLMGSGRLDDGRSWDLHAVGSMEDLSTYLWVTTVEGEKLSAVVMRDPL